MKLDKIIIAYTGRAGSGKDYQCNLLTEQGFTKLAFADVLSEIAFKNHVKISKIQEKYSFVWKNYLSLEVCPSCGYCGEGIFFQKTEM